MPIFFFNLKTAEATIRDPDGMDLRDESSAREHARIVACELMRHREPITRSWRLDVRDVAGRQRFDLLFATVDEAPRRPPSKPQDWARKMEQPLPYATPALAKAVWEHQSSASARSVARALGAAGYPVDWVTVARWRRTGWQPIGPARRHPLALARAGLESVAPLVTGIPTTSIKDLIKEYPNRENLEKADRCRATPHGGP